MEKPPKRTILRLKVQNFLGVAPQTPPPGGGKPPPGPTPLGTPRLVHDATRRANIHLPQENQDLLQAFSFWTTLQLDFFVV